MLKASFQGGFDRTDLYAEIISADNEKQTGQYFKAFVQLMNKTKENIGLLVIIDTSFLHRHYDAKYSNDKVETAWYTKNKKYLELLQIPFVYMSYSKITKSKFYEPHYRRVRLNYAGDEKGDYLEDTDFRHVVKVLSENFLEKGTLREVIKFILDETAGYPALIEYLAEFLIKRKQEELDGEYPEEGLKVDPAKLRITLSYPGGFNGAINYYMEKYPLQSQVSYQEKSYRFRGSTELKLFNASEKNLDLARQAASLDKQGYFSTEHQSNYKLSPFAMNVAYFVDRYRFHDSIQPIVCMRVIETCEKINKEEIQINGTSNKTI